jgi:hypothetical protein
MFVCLCVCVCVCVCVCQFISMVPTWDYYSYCWERDPRNVSSIFWDLNTTISPRGLHLTRLEVTSHDKSSWIQKYMKNVGITQHPLCECPFMTSCFILFTSYLILSIGRTLWGVKNKCLGTWTNGTTLDLGVTVAGNSDENLDLMIGMSVQVLWPWSVMT